VQVPSELLQEIRSLLPLCVRLTHALVDVVSSLGYLKPLIFTMQFCQMLVQGMWLNDSPLLQVLDRPTVQVLHDDYNVKDISEFTEMDDNDRRKVLRGKDIDKIAAACNRYPALTLAHSFGETTDDEVELRVVLEREDELGDDYLVQSRFFPGEKEEFWWVIVGDKKNNKVMSTKRTLVGKQAELQLQVEVADCSRVVVYALCDSYVGCDQAEEIDLN
jgi:pre-mRNA-splicing helicase BRR2